MKTQVTFRSAKFPPYEDEEDEINPGIWGKRLAEYLVAHLKPFGIETEEIGAEDWGWYIPLKVKGVRLAVCCGHQNGDDDEFLCFTDPKSPVIKKWFKKLDISNELGSLVSALGTILSSDPDIRGVEWNGAAN